MPNIASQITSLQFNLGALYSLLGGTSEERQRFFEIHKGITSVAVWERLAQELEAVNEQIVQTQGSIQSVVKTVAVEAQALEG